jgi:hypothetical protein
MARKSVHEGRDGTMKLAGSAGAELLALVVAKHLGII